MLSIIMLLQGHGIWLQVLAIHAALQGVATYRHVVELDVIVADGLTGEQAAMVVKTALSGTVEQGNKWDHFFPLEMTNGSQQEISNSFAKPAKILTKSSSRSGAYLFLSHDGKFFGKTVKANEFQTLWQFAGNGAAASFYREMMCASVAFGMSSCRKSLILPFYLALATEIDNKPLMFVLMPAAFKDERQFFDKFPSFEKDYLGDILDIKPFPSRSEINIFVQLLQEKGLLLDEFDGYSSLKEKVAEDVSYFSRADLIDYSFLVWSGRYEAADKVDLRQTCPSCIQHCQPLPEGDVSCVVLCFRIIDYLMQFTLDRQIESKALYVNGRGDKFLDYGDKARDMLQCLGNVPKLGLEFIECRPYLSAACTHNTNLSVCRDVARHTEEDRHIFVDLFTDVTAVAGNLLSGALSAPKRMAKWYANTLWSVTSSIFNKVTFCVLCPDAEQEQREFLQRQVEAKLMHENSKAAFQSWCQVPGRMWRSFHPSQCVTTDGLRWNMAQGRWEATWISRDARLVLGYKVMPPTEDAFDESGKWIDSFNDFDTALAKARDCLKNRRADLCLQTGGIVIGTNADNK